MASAALHVTSPLTPNRPDPPRSLLVGKGYWKRRRSGKLFSFLVCQVGTKGRRRRQLQVFLYKKGKRKGVVGGGSVYQLNICTLKMPKKAEKAKDKGAVQVPKLVLTPGKSPLSHTPPSCLDPPPLCRQLHCTFPAFLHPFGHLYCSLLRRFPLFIFFFFFFVGLLF